MQTQDILSAHRQYKWLKESQLPWKVGVHTSSRATSQNLAQKDLFETFTVAFF